MKMVVLLGSLRKESINRSVAETIRERYRKELDIEIADLGGLPLYNQDDENHPPESVTSFKQQVAEADGVIIVTPEYNWSIPGVLKNAIDWCSRVDKVLINKPVMAVGASPTAFGTIRAQAHLRDILASPGVQARVLPAATNEVLVNFAADKVKDGRLVDETTLTFLDKVLSQFVKQIKQ
ncbi:NAD(P)H-dependent oxidoreductase [Pullulanibacillus sp. KACC 23026]|uniref:NADPH-dependent FMN reductase n=1 Tax=Pullulanibacillus sp. KACC 23026 TaxID=3028315 RepID=UPI0023AEAA8C|nr:NADPH-dependent FMN reductase [Pullulanibacillus sp. KACC 23026]WEG13727.1 NAD(P)H-dependent oxidoreductase [Pullulanibacillus sp. KACC 23026]